MTTPERKKARNPTPNPSGGPDEPPTTPGNTINVSTSGVGEGGEVVEVTAAAVAGQEGQTGQDAKLAGLLVHEGVRLTQEHETPSELQFPGDCDRFKKLLDDTIDAINIQLYFLQIQYELEQTPSEKDKILIEISRWTDQLANVLTDRANVPLLGC